VPGEQGADCDSSRPCKISLTCKPGEENGIKFGVCTIPDNGEEYGGCGLAADGVDCKDGLECVIEGNSSSGRCMKKQQ
jgi:hypothetical protein